jgi:flavin reductase (DIM6/NTAB) family NADH-FMN oxidoreductase RutF
VSVSPEAHRLAARRFASGVTVAAAGHGGLHHAITATAFCSLSIDPPMVLLAVRSGGRLLELVRRSGCVGISVLGAHQHEVGAWAATRGRSPERTFRLHATVTAATGAPLIPGSLAWFDCRVQSLVAHGDHHVIVGGVEACGVGDGDPLVYYHGGYHELGPLVRPGG